MAFDDDDQPRAAGSTAPELAEEEDLEDEVADYRAFANSLRRGVSRQAIRKGEKDFEPNGTRAQENTLEESRRVLEEILSYTRTHRWDQWARGWYYDEWWAGMDQAESDSQKDDAALKGDNSPGEDTSTSPAGPGNTATRPTYKGYVYDPDKAAMLDTIEAKQIEAMGELAAQFRRDRVVVMEKLLGTTSQSVGKTIPGVKRSDVAYGGIWLLPEEALFLIERGSVDLWYPFKSLPEIWPLVTQGDGKKADSATAAAIPKQDLLGTVATPGKETESQTPTKLETRSELNEGGTDDPMEEYKNGIPLSLEMAYSLFIGYDGVQGKISLSKYQVYAQLKRDGFVVMRAPPSAPTRPALAESKPSLGQKARYLWQWLFSFVAPAERKPATRCYGPLVQPGVYTKYSHVYPQLDLIRRHHPALPFSPGWRAPVKDWDAPGLLKPQPPFQIHFYAWKPDGAAFKKSQPPPPDFRIVVVDARETSLPTRQEMEALLASTPPAPPKDAPGQGGVGGVYRRLKHGSHNVVVAVVDHGVISFVRFADGMFAEEELWRTFDGKRLGGGKKSGQRGKGRAGPRGGKTGPAGR